MPHPGHTGNDAPTRPRPFAIAALLLAAACTGDITGDGAGAGAGPGTEPGATRDGRRTAGPGAPGADPAAPGAPGAAPAGAVPPGEVDPGPAVLRRLTNAQYVNTVRSILKLTNDVSALLPSDRALGEFANGDQQAAPSTGLCQAYGAAAAAVAEAATAPEARARIFDAAACGDRAACLGAFVRAYGRRLFRRPLAADELAPLLAGAGQEAQVAGDFWAGARFALEVMLQSVPFLYVVETGEKSDARPLLLRRDPHTLATRLALLLWNAGPDDALLDLADRGGLRAAADVRAQVARLLDDPRARGASRHFFREWLGYDLATVVSKDPNHTDFRPELVRALVAETDQLVDHVLASGGAVMDLFGADYTFAGDIVRRFYQATTPDPLDPARVKLPRERRGVLGHASFIAANSGPGMQSPTLRGLGVLRRLLCGQVGNPPPTAPAELPESDDKVPRTIRERTEAFVLANPGCNYCHNFMDKVGFLFESFDVIGKHRTSEPVKGAPGGAKPVDATGAILTLGLDRVDGVPGLAAALASHETPLACMLKHFVGFGLGRDAADGDARLLAVLGDAYRRTRGAFRGVIEALATSDAILFMRRPL